MNRCFLWALLLFSGMVHAEWTLVLKLPEFGENYYVDLQSLKEVEGMMQITTLQDFPDHKKEACQGETCAFVSSSRISVRHIQCTAGRQRQIQFTDFDGQMGTGKVTQSAASQDPKKRYFRWYYPAPGSFFEVLIKQICTR
ncbi:MAG: surface-adhesin E family protein [Limnohabitans sp.]